jgi:hypothetical protein
MDAADALAAEAAAERSELELKKKADLELKALQEAQEAKDKASSDDADVGDDDLAVTQVLLRWCNSSEDGGGGDSDDDGDDHAANHGQQQQQRRRQRLLLYTGDEEGTVRICYFSLGWILHKNVVLGGYIFFRHCLFLTLCLLLLMIGQSGGRARFNEIS